MLQADPWYQSVKNVITSSGYPVVAGRLGVMLLLELAVDILQKIHIVLQYEMRVENGYYVKQ